MVWCQSWPPLWAGGPETSLGPFQPQGHCKSLSLCGLLTHGERHGLEFTSFYSPLESVAQGRKGRTASLELKSRVWFERDVRHGSYLCSSHPKFDFIAIPTEHYWVSSLCRMLARFGYLVFINLRQWHFPLFADIIFKNRRLAHNKNRHTHIYKTVSRIASTPTRFLSYLPTVTDSHHKHRCMLYAFDFFLAFYDDKFQQQIL